MTNRVLHVFTAMNVGGAETMILNLYRAIDRNKIQFDFLVHTDETGYYEEEIISLGGRIFRLPYPRLMKIKSYQQQLFRLLKEHHFTAIHSHAHSFSGFILEVARKVPIPIRVAHSHTTSDERNDRSYRKLYQFYMKQKLRKHSTHKFGCSLAAGQALFGDDANITVLPNSFELQKYAASSNKEQTHSKASLVVGHVGRFDLVKNHPFLIETFYHIKKSYPHATAIFVGDGPEKNQILKLIKHYQLEDSIQLLGIRSDIPEIMSRFDLFIFPSLYEGLGNVVIEAQAAGVPCLVSDTIPNAVDLSINLVHFKSINDGAVSWAKEVGRIMAKTTIPNWEDRYRILIENGYDVKDNAKKLEKLYNG